MQTRVLDLEIKKLYDEYKNYMNCEELPLFIIEYIDALRGKELEYSARVLITENPLKLEINMENFDINKRESKAVLYHEFTHIFDFWNLQKKMKKEHIINNFKPYTEYHAIQIENLYEAGLTDNIKNSLPKIDAKILLIKASMSDKNYDKYMDGISNGYDAVQLERAIIKYVSAKSARILAFEKFEDVFKGLLGTPKEIRPFIEDYREDMLTLVNILETTQYSEVASEDVIKRTGMLYNKILKDYLRKQEV